MIVKSRMVEPIKRKDGSWTTRIVEFNEEIPDLGRHDMICNKCGEKTYPECRKWCPMEKNMANRG